MIEIFDDSGEPREYLSVAQRTPQFLAEYGPDKGYAVCTAVKGFLDIHAGLKDAYLAAITAGHNPADVGLPPIDPTLFQFEVRLIDAEGHVLAEASALRRINTDLDAALEARLWEAAETAAFQRLLARTGFGSETLLSDETVDMTARGLDFVQKRSQEQPPADVPEPPAETANASPEQAAAPQQEAATPQAGKKEVAAKKAASASPPKPKATSEAKADTPVSEVSDALLRQIRHLATVRGIEPPEVTTKAQAKEALKSLRGTPAATA